jgi:hypothetical protein
MKKIIVLLALGSIAAICYPSIGSTVLTVYSTRINGNGNIHYYEIYIDVDTNISCGAGNDDRCQFGLQEYIYFWGTNSYILSNQLSLHSSLSCKSNKLWDTGKQLIGYCLPGKYQVIGYLNCYQQEATLKGNFTLN